LRFTTFDFLPHIISKGVLPFPLREIELGCTCTGTPWLSPSAPEAAAAGTWERVATFLLHEEYGPESWEPGHVTTGNPKGDAYSRKKY
jgi:hypothetical protein